MQRIENDKEVQEWMDKEKQREETHIDMIPSENYASKDVLRAAGSIFMNKYAEGYPRKRYYQGNENVDGVEQLAIDRAKKLFNAEHANVQPNSGSPANMAAYFALLKPGDKVLGMRLDQGGHLTHGSPVNFSGILYDIKSYGVDKETGLINMDEVRKIAEAEKPKMIISGYTAYPRTIDFKGFHEIAESIGAYSMADIAHIAGLVAAGVHPSPLPFTDVVTTTTHKTLRGPRSALILCKEKHAAAIDKAVFPTLQGGPHENTIAAKAVAFKEAMQPEFREYAAQIIKNAKAMAESLMENGVSLVSNGTDNHLILIDLIKTKSIAKQGIGKDMAVVLEQAGFVTNANTVPYDPSTPFKPSGVRLGTPIMTTRGMKESEAKEMGIIMADVINNYTNQETIAKARQKTLELCKQFPVGY